MNLAWLELFRVPVSRVLRPSLKVTVPVGVPPPGLFAVTVAVKVTDCPDTDGLAEELTNVVVLYFTVWVNLGDVLPLKRVAAVRRDRVRADRERAGHEPRLARAVQGAGVEGAQAVLEGHRAGRGAPAGALHRHRRGESHRLPGHRRVGRGADQCGRALLHRLGDLGRCASGEVGVAAV